MSPELRRIIAVAAHLRATGHLARVAHALGTGESFDIAPTHNGFRDDASGLEARLDQGFSVDGQAIMLTPRDDVLFDVQIGSVRCWGRAGGGSSVTIYVGDDHFQYALAGAP